MSMDQHNELLPLLDKLSKLPKSELQALGFTHEEIFTVEILTDPVKWAEEYLKWTARDYQIQILRSGSKANRLVLRLGRRLGKTECMCILILWYAFTQINRDFAKNDEDPYDILILTPYEKQIDLIFDRLNELINGSEELRGSIRRKVHHCIELHNNSIITGITVGANTGTGAANTRGQRADLIIYDEVDYMGNDEITNTYNLRNEDPNRIRIIAASTPSGDRRKFYDWCVGATYSYMADVKHIDATGEVRYNLNDRKGKQGTNGWTHIYAPSTVNKKLLQINQDTGLTGMEELREEFTEMRYEQEVMANFGESEDGVYQKKYVDQAVETGRTIQLRYAGNTNGTDFLNYAAKGPRILGVDWDKRNASTNMVGMEYDSENKVYFPFVRVEIPKHEFTYSEAVKMIIHLNQVFNFDWIYCDAGHGEYQIEDLRIHGMKFPESGLQHKVIRVNMSEKVEVRDPFTLQIVKKDIKPFMVNTLVQVFERGQIALNPTDRHTTKQFEDYYIKRWGQDGRPVYTDENEHIHDCIMLAMFGYQQKYGEMLKVRATSTIRPLRPLDMGSPNIKEREIPKLDEKVQNVPYFMSLSSRSGRSRSSRGGAGAPGSRSF